ncbi:LuxR C-terminal-related transcriptional regulator [Streptomyces sp. NPDC102340]|uniref:LuxR C-terminal-related transcriptional regulator n=1 Tax=unclassified Streptomyces TaxID=2593676 RepID=UPI003821BD76
MPPELPASQSEESAQLAMVVVVGGNLFSRIEVMSVVDHEEGFRAVGCAADPDGVRQAVAEHRPDVVAVLEDSDVMPMLQELARCGPGPRVVVVAPSRKHVGGSTVRASVDGMPVHRIHRESLVPALRLVRSGYRVRALAGVRAEVGAQERRAELWRRAHQLTARETEVAELMIKGWSNVEIAEGLELSGATVKSHVHSLMGKLNLKNRIDVITVAYRTGLARRHARYDPTPLPTAIPTPK